MRSIKTALKLIEKWMDYFPNSVLEVTHLGSSGSWWVDLSKFRGDEDAWDGIGETIDDALICVSYEIKYDLLELKRTGKITCENDE